MADESLIRINKFISENGILSRRKADEYILQGRITVNGITMTIPGYKINPKTDKIAIDGELIRIKNRKIYILLNKPEKTISSVSDEKNRKTVIDLINIKERIFPVGRLDWDTTGVLLLTNDGELTNNLLHPSFKVSKKYLAILSKPLEEKHRILLMKGVVIEKKKTEPCKIEFPDKKDRKKVMITLSEGRKHQVKNMFEKFGYYTRKLHREEFCGLKTVNLKPGKWRYLKAEEINNLKNFL